MTNSITFERPISIYSGTGYNGEPIKRLNFTGSDIENVPAGVFTLKVSRSKNPELAGQVILQYMSYQLAENGPWSSRLPQPVTMATPCEQVKAMIVELFRQYPTARFSVNIKIPGEFSNIETPQGMYSIYDFKKNPVDGNVGYYLAHNTPARVTLVRANNKGNDYFRVSLATDLSPNEIFKRGGHGKVWGEEEGVGTTVQSFGTPTFDTPTFDSPVADFNQGQAPAFGQPQTPAFGQGQAPAFGQAPTFGQPQAPAFGAQGQAFGQPFEAPNNGFGTSGFGNQNN